MNLYFVGLLNVAFKYDFISHISFFFVLDPGTRFNCHQCGRVYKRKIHLNSHLRYECGKEPQFKCDFCDKKFHQKSNYRAHVNRHILINNISSAI